MAIPETRYARSGDVSIAYQVVGEGANDIGSRRKHPAARDQDGRRSRRDGRSRVRGGGVVRARRIPGARFVELEGNDHAFFVDSEPIRNATRAFLTEVWEDAALQEAAADRILTTVLFTDIVDSTRHALERGDSAWRDLLAAHHAAVRRQLVRFRGSEVDTAGDGFFATFDGPARAIRSALAIGNDVAALGLQIRVGLHTGECELIDGKVGGVAVHIGARIAALAEPDEVLVSGTVKDLVAGSGIRFEPRGQRELKGLGEWPVYAVVRPDERAFGA